MGRIRRSEDRFRILALVTNLRGGTRWVTSEILQNQSHGLLSKSQGSNLRKWGQGQQLGSVKLSDR